MKVRHLRLLVGHLGQGCWLVGVCFPQVTDEESECLSAFFSKNSYLRGRYDDDSSFAQLNAHLSSLPGGADANRLFYLALPPTVYHHVSTNIRAHCMSSKSVSVTPLSIIHRSSGLLAIWPHSPIHLCMLAKQRLEQADCWEALRPWPRELTGAVSPPVLPVHREPDLPHRPLPGQRDGPEPNGSEVTSSVHIIPSPLPQV